MGEEKQAIAEINIRKLTKAKHGTAHNRSLHQLMSNRLKVIREKLQDGKPLTEKERNLLVAYERGIDAVRHRRETRLQDIADTIAEMSLIERMPDAQICAIFKRRTTWLRFFKNRHASYMMRAYAKIAEIIESKRKARALEAVERLAEKTEAALDVFDDHLAGVKVGNINPAVRQRAAEKVIEAVREVTQSALESLPSGGHIEGLISERQKQRRTAREIQAAAETCTLEAEEVEHGDTASSS